MQSFAVLEQLETANAVEFHQGSIRLTDDLLATVDSYKERWTEYGDEQIDELLAAVDDEVAAVLADNREVLIDHRDLMADVTALYLAIDPLGEFQDDVSLNMITYLAQLYCGPPPLEGAPEAFLPVRGDMLQLLAQLYPQVIVYVWREECDPCDLIRGDLDDLVQPGQAGVPLLAVYGPDWAELLHETYGVVGAPSILFLIDGSVDLRLRGPHPAQVIENELANFGAFAEM